MDAATLHNAISKVSPISSCSVGNKNDRATWTWVSGDGVTQEQIDAGDSVIATIPIDYQRPPEIISDRQFAQALKIAGVITFQEAMAFVQVGSIPALLQGAVDAIQDQTTREAAEMLVAGATEFFRHHPMTVALGTALGWTAEQMDALWATAATL